MRVTAAEFEELDLRAHSLLASVALHDVWGVDLAGHRPGLTITDLRALMAFDDLGHTNAAVRFLFGLRARLGPLFGWDRKPRLASRESFLHRLSTAEREQSLVPPGTREGPFQVLFVTPCEAVSEIHNATVHAFSVLAFRETSSGYRLYWAIYVRPLGPLTHWYMRLIDPFRRFIIYPAVLRHIRRGWDDRAQ
jgi:hypothetical protein